MRQIGTSRQTRRDQVPSPETTATKSQSGRRARQGRDPSGRCDNIATYQAGKMRARVSWLLVLVVYLAFPAFQRERLEGMGFREVLRMDRMRVDPAHTQALRSWWDTEATAFIFPWGHMIPSLEDVSQITGLRVYEHAVSGFTYPGYRLYDLGKKVGETVDGQLLRLTQGCRTVLADEPRAEADVDLRRFLILFLGRLLFATRGDAVHCRFLPLLEELDEVGGYAWGLGLPSPSSPEEGNLGTTGPSAYCLWCGNHIKRRVRRDSLGWCRPATTLGAVEFPSWDRTSRPGGRGWRDCLTKGLALLGDRREFERVRRTTATGASSSRVVETSQLDLEDRLAAAVRRAEETQADLAERETALWAATDQATELQGQVDSVARERDQLRIQAEIAEARVTEVTRELATLRVQGSSADQEELARLRADLQAQQTLARGLEEVITAIGRSHSRSRSRASASRATGASVGQYLEGSSSRQRNEEEERRRQGEASAQSGRGGGEMPPPPDRHEGSGESGRGQ
ncbi:hypothetical protein Taro_006725 [Colocasia esculenta]|uniref:Aminotransferase-like plant mobile domain-containing protein n=1 Tax=Colocasia esculenta TaxID=4460 RepID=A0A843TPI2_COLES|nr:hypothetical protein [Colocasia esculenta]